MQRGPSITPTPHHPPSTTPAPRPSPPLPASFLAEQSRPADYGSSLIGLLVSKALTQRFPERCCLLGWVGVEVGGNHITGWTDGGALISQSAPNALSARALVTREINRKRFSERRRETGRNRVFEQETVNPGFGDDERGIKIECRTEQQQTFLNETGARTEGVFTQQFVISACADQRRSTFPTAKNLPSSPTEANFALSAASLYLAR